VCVSVCHVEWHCNSLRDDVYPTGERKYLGLQRRRVRYTFNRMDFELCWVRREFAEGAGRSVRLQCATQFYVALTRLTAAKRRRQLGLLTQLLNHLRAQASLWLIIVIKYEGRVARSHKTEAQMPVWYASATFSSRVHH